MKLYINEKYIRIYIYIHKCIYVCMYLPARALERASNLSLNVKFFGGVRLKAFTTERNDSFNDDGNISVS